MGNRLSLRFDDVNLDGADDEPPKWLTAYTSQDLERYFARFLKPKLMRDHGFSDDFVVQMDSSDPFVHSLTITHKSVMERADTNERNSFLIKIFVRRDDLPVAALLDGSHRRVTNAHFEAFKAAFVDAAVAHEPRPSIDRPSEPARMTVIEYLYSQNPLAQWTGRHKTPLPSQMYPSLGVGVQMLEMLVSAATDHQRDGLMNRPEHFHNALLYHRAGFAFVSPEFQAYFEVLVVSKSGGASGGATHGAQDDLAPQLAAGFADVSRAIHAGRLGDCATGARVLWVALDQMYPVSRRMLRYVRSGPYRHIVDTVKRSVKPRPYFCLHSE